MVCVLRKIQENRIKVGAGHRKFHAARLAVVVDSTAGQIWPEGRRTNIARTASLEICLDGSFVQEL